MLRLLGRPLSMDPIRYGSRRQYLAFSSTFSRQSEVPKLPLPALEATITKYLETVTPYAQSEAELAETRRLAAAFLADPDVHARQKKLERLRDTQDSWLERLWLDVGYHQWNAPLAINSNVVGYLYGKHRFRAPQAFSAAAVTLGALEYRTRLLKGQIPVNLAKDKPQCMDQYSRMFDLTRIPGEKQDSLVQNEQPAGHIVVIASHRLFKVEVQRDENDVIPLADLQLLLGQVFAQAKQQGRATFPVAALTTGERQSWARLRKRLAQLNPDSLAAVEGAAFVVCLDEGVDVSDADVAKTTLVGDGRSRWMDKSFNLVIKEDGNCSIHVEHSWADAPVPLDMFFNHALPFAERAPRNTPLPARTSWPAPVELPFELDAELKQAIRATESATDAAIADSDMQVVDCVGLGKPVWKQAAISPDAAVQLAMQLAYRRMHGGNLPVATYETIGMTACLHGRTECCRVVSTKSEAFVQAMLNGYLRTRSEPSRVQAEKTLREACDAHIKYIVEGQQGKGIDRHLFGLRLMSSDGSQPALFKDPLFARSGSTGGFILSTSNNSYIARPGWGGMFGAGMPHGYGVCYIPGERSVTLCIESKRSSGQTNSLRFGQMVNECLIDIATVSGVPLPRSML